VVNVEAVSPETGEPPIFHTYVGLPASTAVAVNVTASPEHISLSASLDTIVTVGVYKGFTVAVTSSVATHPNPSVTVTVYTVVVETELVGSIIDASSNPVDGLQEYVYVGADPGVVEDTSP